MCTVWCVDNALVLGRVLFPWFVQSFCAYLWYYAGCLCLCWLFVLFSASAVCLLFPSLQRLLGYLLIMSLAYGSIMLTTWKWSRCGTTTSVTGAAPVLSAPSLIWHKRCVLFAKSEFEQLKCMLILQYFVLLCLIGGII